MLRMGASKCPEKRLELVDRIIELFYLRDMCQARLHIDVSLMSRSFN